MDRTRGKVQSFLRPSLALVDSRSLNVPAARRRLVLFLFGAIHHLGERYGLEETETLAVLVSTLREDLKLHDQEVSQLVAACVNIAGEDGGAELARDGADAARQWSEGEAGTAVQRLAKVVG
jgi:hypothetical protein